MQKHEGIEYTIGGREEEKRYQDLDEALQVALKQASATNDSVPIYIHEKSNDPSCHRGVCTAPIVVRVYPNDRLSDLMALTVVPTKRGPRVYW